MSEEKNVINAVVKQEKMEDIIAYLRSITVTDPISAICAPIVHALADRIEAAWKREREALMPKPEPVGNAAAMREALESVRNWCYNKLNNTSYQVTVEGLLSIVNSALALSTKQR